MTADAPFSQSPTQGAKDNLARHGMRVVFEGKYPLSTTAFTPYMDDLKNINPDVEQAITAVGSTDDAALADSTRKATFETVIGNVTFGENGGWAQPRVLTVQFQNIATNDISEFKRPDTQVVVYSPDMASGSVIYPYASSHH